MFFLNLCLWQFIFYSPTQIIICVNEIHIVPMGNWIWERICLARFINYFQGDTYVILCALPLCYQLNAKPV